MLIRIKDLKCIALSLNVNLYRKYMPKVIVENLCFLGRFQTDYTDLSNSGCSMSITSAFRDNFLTSLFVAPVVNKSGRLKNFNDFGNCLCTNSLIV